MLNVYNPFPLSFSHASGCFLFDKEGKKYLDANAGVGVASLGHSHPKIIEALTSQAQKLIHIYNQFTIEEAQKCADLIVKNTFANQVFFTNSGAETVELALKLARIYNNTKGYHKRSKFLSFYGGFHGRTFLLSAAHDPSRRSDLLSPYLDLFRHSKVETEDFIAKLSYEDISAVLIEPIQGEGGVKIIPPEFLKKVREITAERDILLIFDCIQCGMGRSGKLFAFEHSGVIPDICALAKGLGGGVPVGACLTSEKVGWVMKPGLHGSTYSNNPLVTSVVHEVFDIIKERKFLEQVEEIGRLLRAGLEKLQKEFPGLILEVRGVGLMLGIKLSIENLKGFARKISQTPHLDVAGALLVPTAQDNVLRIMPPLIISFEEINILLNILKKALLAEVA